MFICFYNKGYKYYVVFKDDFIKFLKIYLLVYKLKIMVKFKEFKNYYKTSKKRIHCFRNNNKGEFNNDIFKHICAEYGIK